MLSVYPFRYLACLALLICAQSVTFAADDDKAAKESDPLVAWNKMTDRRDDIIARLEELIKKHKTAAPTEKPAIVKEYNTLVDELQQKVVVGLVRSGHKVLKQQPGNLEVANEVIQMEFRQNHYKQAATVTDGLLKAGKSSPAALNLGGASHFAIHNFAKAKELLSRAKKENTLDQRSGAPYLDRCDDYIEYWKKEKKIRAAEAKADDLPRVVFETTKGRIVLELFENEAPNTVANFIDLVESKIYDGVAFHRVIPNFMSQGGQTGVPFTIDCECVRDDQRNHFQGSLSMAKTAAPNTGSSQFFLTHLPTDHLNGKHTVFGRIIKGIDVNAAITVGDKIKTAKVLRKRKHPYKPKRNN